MSLLTANRKSWWPSHKLQKQTLFGCIVCCQYFKQALDWQRVQSVAMIWTTGFHQILDRPWLKRAATEQLVQLQATIITHCMAMQATCIQTTMHRKQSSHNMLYQNSLWWSSTMPYYSNVMNWPHRDKTGATWTVKTKTRILHGKLRTDDALRRPTSTESPATTIHN